MCKKKNIILLYKVRTDNSVPRLTVWHHSAEPRDAKTVTLGIDLSVRTSHSSQILIVITEVGRSKTFSSLDTNGKI